MTTPEMLDYIRHQLSLGKTPDEIRQVLINTGWHEADVEEGLMEAGHAPAPAGPAEPARPAFAQAQTPAGEGKLPGPLKLFGQAWSIYKSRFWTLISLSLVPLLLWLGVALLAGAGALLTIGINLNGTATMIAGIILALLVIVALLYVSLWSQTALLFAVTGHGEAVGFKEAFKRSSHRIGAYFAIAILTAAVIMGGYALLLIPGIILAIRLAFSQYVMAGENAVGWAALQKSRWYTKNYWWAIFGRLFLMGLALFAVFFIPVFVLQLAKQELAAAIVSWLFSLLFAPLPVIIGFVVYDNLKKIKGQAVITPENKKGGLVALAVWGLIVLLILPLASVGLLAINSARSKSRDAKRFTDMRQISIGLELYLNDFDRYPAALTELSPAYLSPVPLAPQPGDGKCTDQQNQYQYKKIDDRHYTLTFCLGADTGGYSAGTNTLTESGLLSPWEQENYSQPLPSGEAKATFDKFKAANDAKDETEYKKCLAQRYLNLLNAGGGQVSVWYSDLTYIGEKTENNTRVVSASYLNKFGSVSNVEWVFVPEEGAWKLDLLYTMQRSLQQ